jgi:hypothetical protein
MAYITASALLLGDIQISPTVDRELYVAEAADEIDSAIGHLYETPVNVLETGPVLRHSRLLLKRINMLIATGRLVLALNIGDTDKLHAYGAKMLTEGLTLLQRITDGQVALDGAPRPVGDEDAAPGATIVNYDELSAVDAFYDRVMRQPAGTSATLVWAPGAVTT